MPSGILFDSVFMLVSENFTPRGVWGEFGHTVAVVV